MASTMRFDRWEDTLGNSVNMTQVSGGSGLVPVIPSSVTVGSGTASVGANGLVTISGASSISLNNIFTSAYKNYRIIWNITGNTSVALSGQFRYGSTTIATQYYGGGFYINSGGSGITGGASNGSNFFVGNTNTETAFGEIVLSPFTIENSTSTYKAHAMINQFNRSNATYVTGAYGCNSSSILDSFVITGSGGTFTGSLTIHGYR